MQLDSIRSMHMYLITLIGLTEEFTSHNFEINYMLPARTVGLSKMFGFVFARLHRVLH